MGTLIGHCIPGFILYFSGFWNMINTLRILAAGAPFSHRFWYQIHCKYTQRPIEPILKIILCIIGVMIEMGHSASWSIHDTEGNFDNMNDFQHSTMYISFLLTAVVDILIDRNSKLAGFDGFCYFVAFAGEGFLFTFHLGGRPMVDAQIHTCLVVACIMCALGSVLARWQSSNPIISLVFALSVMLHGTWFIHAGVILYPPGSDTANINLMDMEAMMYVTDLFLLHLLAGMSLLLSLYFILRILTPPAKPTKTYVKHPRSEPGSQMYKTVPTSNISTHFYVDSD